MGKHIETMGTHRIEKMGNRRETIGSRIEAICELIGNPAWKPY